MNVKEQLEKIKELRKVAPTIAIVCLISVFTLHKYNEYQNLDKEVKSLENDIALLKSAVSPQAQALLEKKIKETELDLKTTKEKLEAMRKIIPPKANLDEILGIISSDAIKSKVVLNSLKPSAEEDLILFYNKNTNKVETFTQPPNNQNKTQDKNKKQEQKIPEDAVKLKKININIDVSGSFNSIENFLEKISMSDRFISIENISMKKEGETLRALITLSTYYLPEQ
ncbi:MAG: type 4a pilus biogenesis protein PilO [Sulfurihydrogenibium sp.]|nr:type 4a pilus biogenesis protein PilO [Sulfurihydrogenibium sp.]